MSLTRDPNIRGYLTPAQRRWLCQMPEIGCFNLLRLVGNRLGAARAYERLKIVTRGPQGFADAKLTPFGQRARALVCAGEGRG